MWVDDWLEHLAILDSIFVCPDNMCISREGVRVSKILIDLENTSLVK